MDALTKVTENPLNDISKYTSGYMDTLTKKTENTISNMSENPYFSDYRCKITANSTLSDPALLDFLNKTRLDPESFLNRSSIYPPISLRGEKDDKIEN